MRRVDRAGSTARTWRGVERRAGLLRSSVAGADQHGTVRFFVIDKGQRYRIWPRSKPLPEADRLLELVPDLGRTISVFLPCRSLLRLRERGSELDSAQRIHRHGHDNRARE